MPVLKKLFSILLRISISVVLLIFLFDLVDKKSLAQIIHHADKGLIFAAFVAFFFNYFFCLVRWVLLLKSVDIHLPLSRVVISFSGGVFFNLFLPSTIGGDLMRSIDLASHTRKTKEIVATVFLDRLSGYVALVLVALCAIAFGGSLARDKSIFISITLITLFLVFILLVLFNKFIYSWTNSLLSSPNAGKIRNIIRDVQEEIHTFRHKKWTVAVNIFLSVLVQFTGPVTFYFIAKAIGVKISWIYYFIFLPIIGAITLLPISIGGLGLRDATTIYFFGKVGVSHDAALAISLLNFFFILVYGAIGGLIYVLTVRHRRIQHHSPSRVHPKP